MGVQERVCKGNVYEKDGYVYVTAGCKWALTG